MSSSLRTNRRTRVRRLPASSSSSSAPSILTVAPSSSASSASRVATGSTVPLIVRGGGAASASTRVGLDQRSTRTPTATSAGRKSRASSIGATLGSGHDGGAARGERGRRAQAGGLGLVRTQRAGRALADLAGARVVLRLGGGRRGALPAARRQRQPDGAGPADDDVPPRE